MPSLVRESRGFTLIEVLVYLALSLFLTSLVLLVFARTALQTHAGASKINALIAAVLAQDLLIRDVRAARRTSLVCQAQPFGVRLDTPEQTIAWRVQEGRLLRTSKKHPRAGKTWHTASADLGPVTTTVHGALVHDQWDETCVIGCTLQLVPDLAPSHVTVRNKVYAFYGGRA